LDERRAGCECVLLACVHKQCLPLIRWKKAESFKKLQKSFAGVILSGWCLQSGVF
jgi:hypothetical protein